MTARTKKILARSGLALAGLLVGLLAVEAALQAVVFAHSRPPQPPAPGDGTARILCFGESTTRNQYPPRLEKILCERLPKLNVRVIDCGKAGTNTAAIIGELPGRMAAYKPVMVIAMMGINDEAGHLYAITPDRFRKFRTLYLLRLLWGQFLAPKYRQAAEPELNFAQAQKKPPVKNEKELLDYADRLDFSRADAFGAQLRPIESFLMYNNSAAALIAHLKTRLENGEDGPAHDLAFLTAALCLEYERERYLNPRYRENIAWLIRLLSSRIESRPKDIETLLNLAQLHFLLGDTRREKEFLERAFALEPETARAARALADEYMRRGESLKAEEILRAAEKNFGPDRRRKDMLLFLLIRNEKYAEAEELAAQIRPATRSQALALERTRSTVAFLRAMKKHNRRYAKRLLKNRTDYIHADTRSNYKTMAELVRAHGLPFVAVQYPMRETAPLKEMLKDFPATVFVDNCPTFVRAVMEKGYGEYFADCFAGDFGHCTDAGNRMLAENIADKIVPLLKDLEEKSGRDRQA